MVKRRCWLEAWGVWLTGEHETMSVPLARTPHHLHSPLAISTGSPHTEASSSSIPSPKRYKVSIPLRVLMYSPFSAETTVSSCPNSEAVPDPLRSQNQHPAWFPCYNPDPTNHRHPVATEDPRTRSWTLVQLSRGFQRAQGVPGPSE